MQDKILFYKGASELPDGLSLADYEYRFYADNAGKEILTVEVGELENGDVLAYDSAEQKWKNSDTSALVGPAGPEGPAWCSTGPQGPDTGETGDSGATGPQGAFRVFKERLGATGDLLGATRVFRRYHKVPQGDSRYPRRSTGATGPKGGLQATLRDHRETSRCCCCYHPPFLYDAPTQTVSLDAM
jgi:hypothetical protein